MSVPVVVAVIVGSLAVGPQVGRADALTTVTDQPIEFPVTNPCTAENVEVTGTIHFVSTSVQTRSGVTVSTTSQIGKRLQGIGDMGTLYSVVFKSVSSFHDRAGGASGFTAPIVFSYFSRSGAANFVSHGVVHGTFNAQGQLTSDFAFNSTECRG